MSIRYKISAVVVAVLLLVGGIVTAIWFTSATDMAETYLEDMSESIMKDASNAFEYLLTDTNYMITLLAINEENIVQPVQNINNLQLRNNGQFGPDYLENQRTIRAFMRAVNGTKYYIVGLGVAAQSGYVFQTATIVQNNTELFEMITQLDDADVERSMVMMAPVETADTWFSRGSNYVVPAVRAITDDRQQVIGYVVMYFDYSVIEDIFSNNLPEGSLFQVVDKNDNIIYSNCGDALLDAEAGQAGYVYNTFHAENVAWDFVMAIPSAPILGKAWQTLQLTLVLLVVTLLGTIAASIWIVSRMTRHIKTLTSEMNRVAAGDLTVQTQIHSNDEIGSMEKTFNHMVRRVGELMDAVTEEEEQKRLMEIAFLQAQINPHFISNTLNLIVWMAKVKHIDSIEPLANALNTMLRGAMKKGDDLIPLREEMAHVKSFLEIIEYSGNYDFTLEIDIPPGVEGLSIPRFILQPIVENAIYHGMPTQLGKESVLRISAEARDEKLTVCIEDNGPGLTKEQIDAILHEESRLPQGFNGVGISNVLERIQLFFGPEYGLRYESVPEEYTRAVFTLPVVRPAPEEKSDGIH